MSGIMILGAIVAVIIVVVSFIVSVYNRLIKLRNRFKNAFSQIDVQLTRRHDLIPNLVNTAKGYMKHERETLEAVIKARSAAVDAGKKAAAHPEDGAAVKGFMGAENMLTGALGRLFALSESYPDLKANENMMQLTEELASTENRVAFARQAFNDAVMTYNNSREVFPANIVASMFNFKEAQLFELENQEAKQAPQVQF